MKLCILCEDANINEARQRSLEVLPIDPNQNRMKLAIMKAKGVDSAERIDHLKVPVSPTGDLPATHWFCFITVDDDTHQRMLDNQLYTTIEEGVPSEFLAKHGLQRIKSKSTTY
jgi:hypothetical protein